MAEDPAVSVVVCTHNGARLLPRALGALGRQVQPAGGYEVIVVDDRSTDGSGEIAAASGARVVRLTDDGGLAAARNAGIRAASGGIIAFTDDDCEPDAGWLSALLAPFADPGVSGTAGCTVPSSADDVVLRYLARRNPLAPLPSALLESRSPLFRLWHYLRTGLGPTPALPSGSELYSVAGANMAFRRELLDAIGGFDPRISFGGEEEDLCRRAHERAHERPGGARFVYVPAALVHHHYRPGLRDTLRRARAYGRGNARQTMSTAGAWPIVYPFPLVIGVPLITALLTRRRYLPLITLLPPLLYPGWLIDSVRRGDPEALFYAYIQVAQEGATMVGEAQHFLGLDRR